MNYFIHNERDLSRAYVKSCKKFLNNLKLKKKNSGPGRNRTSRPQASSVKQSPHLNDINKPERNNYVKKRS